MVGQRSWCPGRKRPLHRAASIRLPGHGPLSAALRLISFSAASGRILCLAEDGSSWRSGVAVDQSYGSVVVPAVPVWGSLLDRCAVVAPGGHGLGPTTRRETRRR